MENINESISEIKRFLKKLNYIIENDTTFNMFGNRYVEKNKVDDIWVCVEANFPIEYKKLLRLPNDKKYKSVALYHQLKLAIHEKSKMLSSCYAIRTSAIPTLSNGFMLICEQDIKMLYKSL